MSPEILGAVCVVVMIILIFLRMWIGVAMLLVGLVGYALIRDFPQGLRLLSLVPFRQASFYTLTTIPLFVFMGQIILNSGIGADLYNTAYKWVGQLRGGLVMATVPACAAFGAISGVPIPALVTLGKVALPEMRKYGYNDSFATGSIVSSATLAVLIPPSIPMIVYGFITETPIGALFMAGILPGIMLAILFMITILMITRINPKAGPAGPTTSWRTKVSSLKFVWPVLVLFVLVLGGLYGGLFTPTEAGAIGAFGACILAGVMRRLTFKSFIGAVLDAVGLTAMIMFLIVGAQVFSRLMALSRLPALLASTLGGLGIPVWGVFMLLVLLYIILGLLLDIMSVVIITMPVIFPFVTGLGFDPVWFGVVIVMLVQMGCITPPVGMDVFVLAGAIDVPIFTVFKGVFPFVLTVLIAIVILLIFPDIALILPRAMW